MERTASRLAAVLGAIRVSDRWLLVLGILVWLVSGSTSIVQMSTAAPAGPRSWTWLLCYLAFGGLLILTTDRRRSRAVRLPALVVQGLLAGTLALSGMPLFEGALLAMVAAQVPTVLPMRAAVPWALFQVLPLWLALAHSYQGPAIIKSICSYLGFTGFALITVQLMEAERQARRELDQAVRDLIITRALLAERTRTGERMRIARELHDVLGHHLAALGLHLDLARRTCDAAARVALDEAHAMVQRILEEARAAVHNFGFERFDLSQAVREMVKGLTAPRVHVEAPGSLPIDGAERAAAAFRVVQEAVTNALKHADSRNLFIVLAREGGHLEVSVTDDGKGSALAAPGDGIRGMRARVEGVGGAFTITSEPGRGTAVRARIPIGGSP